MEVNVNKSIEIPKTEKKKRPRISDLKREMPIEDSANSVKTVSAKAEKPARKFNKNNKPKFEKKERRFPKRTTEEIKEGIVKSLESVGGKYVTFDDINHTEGLLVCGVIDAIDPEKVTDKDIFFAVVNHDRHLVYVSCKERFSVQREPSMKCSILDWLYRNEANTIINIANNTMEDNGVEIFTDVYLVAPKVEKKKPIKRNKKK